MAKKEVSEILKEAVAVLKDGGTILYPTDTVWGLGCDATNPDAVAEIYDIKHRLDSKALVLLASDLDMVARYVKTIPQMAISLVEVNDRPMTIVYPDAIAYPEAENPDEQKADRFHLAHNVVADDGTVGIRIPMMDFCRQLALKLGRPVVSTSANVSGEPAPKCYSDIPEAVRNAVDYVVDASLEEGATGMASQIIKVGIDGEVKIIRP